MQSQGALLPWKLAVWARLPQKTKAISLGNAKGGKKGKAKGGKPWQWQKAGKNKGKGKGKAQDKGKQKGAGKAPAGTVVRQCG
eukprot:4407761-Amphidinium_carterae.1